MRLRLVLATTLALCFSESGVRGVALAQTARDSAVVLVPRERRYAVIGTTATELAQSIRRDNPFDVPGRRGSHQAEFRRRADLVRGTRGCEPRNLRITVESEITLPEWVPRDPIDSTLVRQWARFVTDLRTHEEGHRAISMRIAEEAAGELRALRTPSCAAWSVAADSVIQRKLREHQNRQDAHDSDRRAGVGAQPQWPPRPPPRLD